MADLVVVTPSTTRRRSRRPSGSTGTSWPPSSWSPISYNQGCIPADPDFLRQVRQTCTDAGIVLIFDEVLSGFRMCRGGAQEYYGVTPDLCTLAKALGGGVPIAAVCGKTEVMSVLNPVGRTGMSGTYTGHLTAVMAAIACQKEIAKPGFYPHINQLADRLYAGIREALRVTGVPGVVQGIGARFGIYLGVTEPVTNYREACRCDRAEGDQVPAGLRAARALPARLCAPDTHAPRLLVAAHPGRHRRGPEHHGGFAQGGVAADSPLGRAAPVPSSWSGVEQSGDMCRERDSGASAANAIGLLPVGRRPGPGRGCKATERLMPGDDETGLRSALRRWHSSPRRKRPGAKG